MKLKIFIPLLFAVAIAASCKVSFVPAYDNAAVELVKSGQSLTTKLHQPENAVYSDTAYSLYSSYIQSLKSFNQSRANAKLVLPLITRYQSAFVLLRAQHSRKVTLTQAELEIHNSQLQAFLKNLLTVENNFKNK